MLEPTRQRPRIKPGKSPEAALKAYEPPAQSISGHGKHPVNHVIHNRFASPQIKWQQPFAAVTELPSRKPDSILKYGPSAEQRIELWLPPDTGHSAPVAILIHGGCWLDAFGVEHIRPLATALSDRGYAVWAPEYRRVGQNGGGWPGTFKDIAQATDRLRIVHHPALNPSRAVLVGHSAGGQLALWAAGRSGLTADQALYAPEPFIPRGVIGLAAITDLAAYANGENSCQAVTQRLMGGMPSDHPGRYAQASPTELDIAIPTLLMYGEEDPIVPPEQAKALAGARRRRIARAGHFDLIHPGTPAFGLILEELEAMLTA